MHKKLTFVLGTALFVIFASAQAEIYKHIDDSGRVTYSNIPTKGAKKLDLDPLSTVPSPKTKPSAANNVSPTSFPKVDTETQKKRDDTRRKLLEDELAAEEKLLAEAKKAATEGEAIRSEKNYQLYLDRVAKLKENVLVHEKNIEALKKELTGLK